MQTVSVILICNMTENVRCSSAVKCEYDIIMTSEALGFRVITVITSVILKL